MGKVKLSGEDRAGLGWPEKSRAALGWGDRLSKDGPDWTGLSGARQCQTDLVWSLE